MNIILENDILGRVRTVKGGIAKYYMFYIAGMIITLILALFEIAIGLGVIPQTAEVAFVFLVTGVIMGIVNGAFFLTVLIISIMRKQFKVFLSFMIWFYIADIALFIIFAILPFSYFLQTGLQTLIISIFSIILMIPIIKNLNYWSYNAYIKQGYVVTNLDRVNADEFIENAKSVKKPFWVFFI